MKLTISPQALRDRLNGDSEFRLQARYWSGALQLQFGDDAHVLRLTDGEVERVEATSLAGSERRAVIVRAPVADWAEFVKPVPPPLYHELYPAMWHHGFELLGDDDYIWTYYAALRRAGEIVRELAEIEEG